MLGMSSAIATGRAATHGTWSRVGILTAAFFGISCWGPTEPRPDPNLPPDYNYPVVLSPLAGTQIPGATIRFFLRNDGPKELGYNFCSAPIERRVSGGWVEAPTHGNPCPGILYILFAGDSVETGYFLAARLSPGEYRVRAYYFPSDSLPFPKRSGSFTVR